MLETLKTVVAVSAIVCGTDALALTWAGSECVPNHYVSNLAKTATMSVWLLEGWFPGPLSRFNEMEAVG